MRKKLFNVMLHNWRYARGTERYQIIEKLFDKKAFIKMIDEKIKNQQDKDHLTRTLRIELPLVRWQEFDKNFYDEKYNGWQPSPNILERIWMRIGEFAELVESCGTRLLDYNLDEKVGIFEIIKKIGNSDINNVKEFIAPISGARFVIEQGSDNVSIIDRKEIRILVPKEDFIGFLNYVAADLGN